VGGFRELGELRDLLGERDVDLVERSSELVVIEVLELERAGEDDLSVLETEAAVHERLRVDGQELLIELAVRRRISVDVTHVDPEDHERWVDPQDRGGHVVAAVNEERAGLIVDVGKTPVHLAEVRLDVLDATHGCRVSLRYGVHEENCAAR
jgi:hypothetical protein